MRKPPDTYINRCSSQLQCLHLLLPEEGSAGLQQQRPRERSLQQHCRSEGGKQSAKHVEGCSLCQNVLFRGPHCHAKPPGQFLGASLLLLAIAPWLSSFSTGSIQSQGQGGMFCFEYNRLHGPSFPSCPMHFLQTPAGWPMWAWWDFVV